MDLKRENPAGQSVLNDFIPRDLKIKRHDSKVCNIIGKLMFSNINCSQPSADASADVSGDRTSE